jgi:hypothetical protein
MMEAMRSSYIFKAILMTLVLKVVPAYEIIIALISFNSSMLCIPVLSLNDLLLFDFLSPDFYVVEFFLKVESIFSIILSSEYINCAYDNFSR